MRDRVKFLVPDLIRKKRDGEALSPEEISFLVKGFSDGTIPDYQVSAWLMASYLKGLTKDETLRLTRAMRDSGHTFSWRETSANFKNAKFADKHSSGGVGDKVSLILAPVAACLGLKVPMMSGRGLGHTGGTVDKLESIDGFNMHPSVDQIVRLLDDVGVCMMAQAADLCPADRKLYHLRDVTATIDNVPLITASIVSKKWAEGAEAIVFDVKCGSAAFMNTPARAQALATSLVEASTGAGLKARAWITRMDEPLGSMVGHALEVKESLWILANEFPSARHKTLAGPLTELSLGLAAEMAVLAGARRTFDEALADAKAAIESKLALRVFQDMAKAQGARDGWFERLAQAEKRVALSAPRAGRITAIDSFGLAMAAVRLGGGRLTSDDKIDPAVGLEMVVRPGDDVAAGDALLYFHVRPTHDQLTRELASDTLRCFTFDGPDAVNPDRLLLGKVPA